MGSQYKNAQLSIEFLVYSIISMLTLIVVLSAYTRYSKSSTNPRDISYVSAFVSLVETNKAFESSNFTAYMPKSICNANVSNGILEFDNDSFYLGLNLHIPIGEMCAASPGFESFRISTDSNGQFLKVV